VEGGRIDPHRLLHSTKKLPGQGHVLLQHMIEVHGGLQGRENTHNQEPLHKRTVPTRTLRDTPLRIQIYRTCADIRVVRQS
jgi:hypothetical protein